MSNVLTVAYSALQFYFQTILCSSPASMGTRYVRVTWTYVQAECPCTYSLNLEKKVHKEQNITLSYVRCCFFFERAVGGPGCGGRWSVYNERQISSSFLYTLTGQYQVILVVFSLCKGVWVFLFLLQLCCFSLFFFAWFLSCLWSCIEFIPVLTSFHLVFQHFPCSGNIYSGFTLIFYALFLLSLISYIISNQFTQMPLKTIQKRPCL